MAKKPMTKFFKFVLIVAGIFIVLLAGVAIFVAIKFPPEKIKALAVEKMAEALKRKVSLGGAKFNVLSGIQLTDLKISNRPGWAEGFFVTAKDISISYHIFPLLWGQISLGEIKLNQPQILVERRGLSDFNFSDMMGDSSAVSASAPPVAPAHQPSKKTKGKAKAKKKKKSTSHASLPIPVEESAFSSFFVEQAWADSVSATQPAKPSKTTLMITVDSINITRGKMTYLDERYSPAQKSDLDDLNFKVKNISLTGQKTTFSMSTPFTYQRMHYQFALGGAFRYFLSSQTFKDLDVKGSVNDAGFEFAGDLKNMSTNFAPDIKGSSSLEMIKTAGLVPSSVFMMPKELSITGPARILFHLGGTLHDGLKLSGTLDGSDMAIQYKDLFLKAAKAPFKADFESVAGNDYYNVPRFKAVFQDWEATGSFTYRNGGDTSFDFQTKALPLKGVPAVVPRLKKAQFGGHVSVSASGLVKSGNWKNLKAHGQIGLTDISVVSAKEPHFLEGLTGNIPFTETLIQMPSLKFKLLDGTGTAAMNINLKSMAYNYALNLNNVSAQETVDGSVDLFVTKAPEAYMDKIFGSMNFAYRGSGKGTTSKEMEASAVGSGTYSIIKAKVKGYDAIKSVNSIFGDKSDEIVFDKIDGTIGVKSQVASYTANTEGKVGTIRVIGGVSFDSVYTPDMKILCDIKREFLDSAAVKSIFPGIDVKKTECIKDADTLPMDCRFTGVVKENHYSWDRSRLEKFVLDCGIKNGKKAAESAVQQGAQDLGKKLGIKF